ncbi:hypothetical protein [Nocardiopsis sp. NPDC058789]
MARLLTSAHPEHEEAPTALQLSRFAFGRHDEPLVLRQDTVESP